MATRDVVVARRDVGHQRAEHVERRLVAQLAFLLDVHLDQMHRDVARSLDHHLDAGLPGLECQLAERFQFGELGRVVGIGQAARAQAIAQAEGHVVGAHDVAQFAEVGVPRVLLMCVCIHRAMSEPPRLTMPVMRSFVSGMYSLRTPA